MVTVEIKSTGEITTFHEQVIALAVKYGLSAEHAYRDDYGFFDEQGKKIKNFIGLRNDKVVVFFYNFKNRQFLYDLDQIERYLKILLKVYEYAKSRDYYSMRLEKVENYVEWDQLTHQIYMYEDRLLNLDRLTE